VGASAGPDAGHSAGDRGHPEQFRELARGFPWAWGEEVVAGAAHLPARQSARLAVASLVVADAIAEVVLRRGVPQAAGPERGSWGA
jgi:hypothetical protein